MPPVAAVAAAVAPLAVPVMAGAAVYTAVSQSRATKEAQSEAKKARLQEQEIQQEMFGRELEAGEYFEELGKQQMELQVQSSNIKTLADLIQRESQPPVQQIITLPPATEYSTVTQINQAIGKLLGR